MTARKSAVWLRCTSCVALVAVVLCPSIPTLAAEDLRKWVDPAEVFDFSDDPTEVLKTWEHGHVFVPGAVIGEFIYGKIGSPSVQSRLAAIPEDVRHPLVVYLHDAGGISAKIFRLQKALEVENFAMVLPDSFARSGRKRDCGGKARKPEDCAMSPEIYLLRRAELIHAVRAARQLSWVDQDNVFLMGSGEGAGVVALWGAEVDVSGYVIIDWTCTAPADRPWFDGLRTPSNRLTLVLTTSDNRWLAMPGWGGNCADKASAHADVDTLIIESGIRDVFGLPESRRAIIEFLYLNMRTHAN